MSQGDHALIWREFYCPTCKARCDYQCYLSEPSPHLHCPNDGALLHRYFGNMRDVSINYGFRESKYYNPTDENIARYQFTHL